MYMLTPQQLNEISFKKARIGGYDMASVDELLEPLTSDYIALYNDNAALKNKMRVMSKKLDDQRSGDTDSYAATASTKKTCDNMIRETEAKCAKMLSDANASADSIIHAAKASAVDIVTAAKAAAADILKNANQAAEGTRSSGMDKNASAKISEIQAQMMACVEALEQFKTGAVDAPKSDVPAKPKLTGKPSVDRPWMKYYPADIEKMMTVPEVTIGQYLRMMCRGMDLPVIHYYGTDISWSEFFRMVDEAARAMRAAGLGCGDQVPALLRSVPEFLVVLLAAERIGASLLCRDNTIEENAEAMAKANAKVLFAHDFITQAEVDAYCAAGIKRIITVDPWRLAVKKEMPQYIIDSLESNYTEPKVIDDVICDWNTFIAAGRVFADDVDAPIDLDRPLFRAYTSGSTGPSKQVIHSARTMLSVVYQMSDYGNSDEFRPTWLMVLLPPALVAVPVSMLLVPMTSNRLLILDPFVDVYDIDLELMRYKPNIMPQIPMFTEILKQSKRIPKDYDMSHLLACGAGAEATNNGQIRSTQAFLESHNCHVVPAVAYGQSEAGSNITFPVPGYTFENGNVGIPMPLNIVSIFRGNRECTYNKLGEICVTGPGIMLGYDDKEATEKTLIRHADGKLWLHTGDTGYINEDGVVFALGRGLNKRYDPDPEKAERLVDVMLENLVCDAEIPGLKDCFFVIRPDKEHDGYSVPYMYAVLEDGYTLDEIQADVNAALEPYQRPVEIIQIPTRPFYHFKTNRLHLDPPYAR